tara:strand:- start:245 stop:568 length:324 start_codon:yes stop_codon:yes gene_type:complete
MIPIDVVESTIRESQSEIHRILNEIESMYDSSDDASLVVFVSHDFDGMKRRGEELSKDMRILLRRIELGKIEDAPASEFSTTLWAIGRKRKEWGKEVSKIVQALRGI